MADLTEFNTGGSHEENPLGGIPQGVGPNGAVNTVEEGETKKGDYVYSDSLRLNKTHIKEFNLPKYLVGKTYADATKVLEKKFGDRQDNATRSTKEAFNERLKSSQELAKEQKEARSLDLSLEEYRAVKAEQAAKQAAEQAAAQAEAQAQQKAQQGEPQETPPEMKPSMEPTKQFAMGGALTGAVDLAEIGIENSKGGLNADGTAAETDAGASAVQGAIKGASAGAAFGPIGIAGGAVLGGAVSGLTALAGNKKGLDMEQDLAQKNAAKMTTEMEGQAAPEVIGVKDSQLKASKGFDIGEAMGDAAGIATGVAGGSTPITGVEKGIDSSINTDIGAMDISKLKYSGDMKYGGEMNQYADGGPIPKWLSEYLKSESDKLNQFRTTKPTNYRSNPEWYSDYLTAEEMKIQDQLTNPYNPFNGMPGYEPKGPIEPTTKPIDSSVYPSTTIDPTEPIARAANLGTLNLEDLPIPDAYGVKQLQKADTPVIGAQQDGPDAPKKDYSKLIGAAGLAASLAPFAGNIIAGSNVKRGEPTRYVRAGRTYIPEFADEKRLLNEVDQSFAGTADKLAEASGGDAGAYRSNLLASNVLRNKARMDAYSRVEDINRAERKAMNADYAAAVKEDTTLANKEQIDKLQDEAAYQAAKNAYKTAAYEGLGKIGETIFGVDQMKGLTSYDIFGNKKNQKEE